jgi:hypothetical protein
MFYSFCVKLLAQTQLVTEMPSEAKKLRVITETPGWAQKSDCVNKQQDISRLLEFSVSVRQYFAGEEPKFSC